MSQNREENYAHNAEALHITGSVDVSNVPSNQPIGFILNTSGSGTLLPNSETIPFQGELVNGVLQVSGIGDNFTINLTLNETTNQGATVTTLYTLGQSQLQLCPICSNLVPSLFSHITRCTAEHIERHAHQMSTRVSFIGGRFYYLNINCHSCPSCSNELTTHTDMVSHLSAQHSALTDYVCRRCSFSSDYFPNLLSHVIDKHT